MDKKKKRLGSRLCQCGSCGRYFGGLTAFDTHRAGTYRPDTRHCLSDEALQALGLVNREGVWGSTYQGPIVDPSVAGKALVGV